MNQNMHQLFRPGDVIHGFCNGFFGRDDYQTKTCVMVSTKFAVFEYESGFATVLNLTERLDKTTVDSWRATP